MFETINRKINIMPLPADQREERVKETFEALDPGETMQVIDDFDPKWIRSFLEETCSCKLDNEGFVIEQSAGRFVAFIRKPRATTNDGTSISGSPNSFAL